MNGNQVDVFLFVCCPLQQEAVALGDTCRPIIYREQQEECYRLVVIDIEKIIKTRLKNAQIDILMVYDFRTMLDKIFKYICSLSHIPLLNFNIIFLGHGTENQMVEFYVSPVHLHQFMTALRDIYLRCARPSFKTDIVLDQCYAYRFDYSPFICTGLQIATTTSETIPLSRRSLNCHYVENSIISVLDAQFHDLRSLFLKYLRSENI